MRSSTCAEILTHSQPAADASPVRSPMETRAPPPSFAEPVLFASSLPITIPLATYQPTTTLDGLEQRRLDGVEQKHTLSASLHEDLDDETQFVAPHVLSARTYQEGAVFGDLPSRRHRRAGGL